MGLISLFRSIGISSPTYQHGPRVPTVNSDRYLNIVSHLRPKRKNHDCKSSRGDEIHEQVGFDDYSSDNANSLRELAWRRRIR